MADDEKPGLFHAIGAGLLAIVAAAAVHADAPPPAPGAAPSSAEPARPHLVVAGAANPPADGPVDPLVFLVRDADTARIERLAEGCTALDHRCVVIACPPAPAPAAEACVAGWQATWAELSTDEALVGHPEALLGALAGSVHVRAQAGSWLYDGVATPMGVTVGKRAIR